MKSGAAGLVDRLRERGTYPSLGVIRTEPLLLEAKIAPNFIDRVRALPPVPREQGGSVKLLA